MDTMEVICSRRSVRSYTGEQITKDELGIILRAANAAPVGMGRYGDVHLTVITDPELLSRIDRAGALMFGNPDAHPLYFAPTLVLVSAKEPTDAGMANVTYSNAAIIVQNMALAATELGVGACHIWGAVMAMRGDGELIRELGIPEGFVPCSAITLGRTDIRYTPREIPDGRIATNIIE